MNFSPDTFGEQELTKIDGQLLGRTKICELPYIMFKEPTCVHLLVVSMLSYLGNDFTLKSDRLCANYKKITESTGFHRRVGKERASDLPC